MDMIVKDWPYPGILLIGPPARLLLFGGEEGTSLDTDELGIKLAGSVARNDDSDGGSMGGLGDDGRGRDIDSNGAVGDGGGDGRAPPLTLLKDGWPLEPEFVAAADGCDGPPGGGLLDDWLDTTVTIKRRGVKRRKSVIFIILWLLLSLTIIKTFFGSPFLFSLPDKEFKNDGHCR